MSTSAVRAAFSGRGRVVALRYLAIATIANLGWEVLQLPLYTIWRTGTPGGIAYAIIHCTAGDVVLVGATLFVALLLAGDDGWPWRGYVRVAVITTALGIACAIFSEWLNVEVRRSWAYTPAMQLLPLFGTGLSPLMRWAIIPPVVLTFVKP